jgi:hypothetical protein
MTIVGVSVAAEHLRCLSIQPAHDFIYVPNAIRFVRMYYQFEVVFGSQLGSYPFQHRILDQGEYGWWSDGGTKRREKFSDGKGEVVGGPIRLDGTGLPLASIYSSIKVGKGNATPVTPPTAAQPFTTEYTAAGSIAANAKAAWLYYRKSRSVDLRALGL